jgi:tyrosyl-tRNA synthetase
MRPIKEQLAILMQGTEYGDDQLKQAMEKELDQRLVESRRKGAPLRVYCGFDPRTSDLHLGHTVVMYKLRQFQKLGHQVTFLIGTYTSLVGDPSDKDKLRPQLSFDEVMQNAETYAQQAFRILDPELTLVRYNHEWLEKLTFEELIGLASHFTVQQFLARESFRLRWDKGDGIYVHELFYALMQGYDAVAQETDVQVGGSDQLFNIVTAGRKLQPTFGQRPQVGIIMGILPGTDGKIKMSKSLGNHIRILAAPEDMFGKVMSLPDEVMPTYFKLVTRYEPGQISTIEQALADSSRHPMEIKMELAEEIVSIYHDQSAAREARAHFQKVFQRHQLPDEMPVFKLDSPMMVVNVMAAAGMTRSKGEARRLVQQNAVSLDGVKVSTIEHLIEPKGEQVLRVGRRRFLKIVGN